MAYATAQDVADRLGRALDISETTLVESRLEDAELLLNLRITDPTIADRIADPVTYPHYLEIVKLVETEMVLRLVRNPEGYSQESDGNYSYAIYQSVASGKLEVTPEEWKLLGVGGGGMFTIDANLPVDGYVEGAYDPSKGFPPWYYYFPDPDNLDSMGLQ